MLFTADYKIKLFWKWFTKHSEEYLNFEHNQGILLNELYGRLLKINKALTFELSPPSRESRELIISCDGNADAIKKVISVVDQAPRIGGWKIRAFRQRVSVGVIEFEGRKFSTEDILYEYTFREDNRINLRFFIKDYDEDDTERCMGATFILLDHLIGEYDVMTKIGQIDFLKLDSKNNSGLRPLTTLPDLVDSRMGK